MASSTGGGSMDQTPITKWGLFKTYLKKSPLIFWPFLFIMVTIPVRFLFSDPLAQSIISMTTTVAMGSQWIGIVRQRAAHKIEMVKFDKEHLESLINLNNIGRGTGFNLDDEFRVKFLVDCPTNRIRSLWYKLRNKRLLSLYSLGEGRSSSFTKIIVTDVEWFYLQLRDCIGTTDPELLNEGVLYLKRDENELVTTT